MRSLLTVAACLLLLVGAVGTVQAATPDPSPDAAIAARIDRVLRKFDFPLAPIGVAAVEAGRKHHLNPYFVLAISGVESTFAREACGKNAWGWSACRQQPPWSSFWEGQRWMTRLLRDRYLNVHHLYTVEAIGNRYCDGCPSWAWEVKTVMRQYFCSGPGILFKDAVKVTPYRQLATKGDKCQT
jgi:hypothetical protein